MFDYKELTLADIEWLFKATNKDYICDADEKKIIVEENENE